MDDGKIVGCVGDAAIGSWGLKWRICVNSGLFLTASLYLAFCFGILFFETPSTLLVVEMQSRDAKTIQTSACFFNLMIFLLRIFFSMSPYGL